MIIGAYRVQQNFDWERLSSLEWNFWLKPEKDKNRKDFLLQNSLLSEAWVYIENLSLYLLHMVFFFIDVREQRVMMDTDTYELDSLEVWQH